ncbi:MAG TPA: hypothetical protein VFB13_04055 [Reyranella sp.]|jgi:hypothetical protein|nr:hypothetical protein [Reyranella sp.]
MPVAPNSLSASQVRILSALLEDESMLKGGDLARRSGYRDLDALARDIGPLVEGGLVHVAGPLDGADVFYTVFALRPSDMATAQAFVRRAAEA